MNKIIINRGIIYIYIYIYIYICIYIYCHLLVNLYIYMYGIWKQTTNFVYIFMLGLIFFIGALFFTHSTPPFRIRPTAIERMLFWFLLCFFELLYWNFLCYFRKDFNFSLSKAPMMNFEKMLKIIYQRQS